MTGKERVEKALREFESALLATGGFGSGWLRASWEALGEAVGALPSETFHQSGPFLTCKNCGHVLFDGGEEALLDSGGGTGAGLGVTLKEVVDPHVGHRLLYGGEAGAAAFDWANLEPGHLVVVDALKNLPEFGFLACYRDECGGFGLFYFVHDLHRTFARHIESVRLPLNDLDVIRELEGLHFFDISPLLRHEESVP